MAKATIWYGKGRRLYVKRGLTDVITRVERKEYLRLDSEVEELATYDQTWVIIDGVVTYIERMVSPTLANYWSIIPQEDM